MSGCDQAAQQRRYPWPWLGAGRLVRSSKRGA
jgi:hypothetical protein